MRQRCRGTPGKAGGIGAEPAAGWAGSSPFLPSLRFRSRSVSAFAPAPDAQPIPHARWRRCGAAARALVLAAALGGVVTATPPAAATESWPDWAINPQPAEGDLVLPMPCGGGMAFRPVEVPSDGLVDDRQVLLGDVDDRLAYAENIRYAHVAGGFTDPADPARRLIWLAKYEVTVMQLAALSGTCPEAAPAGRLPAAGVTWAEAVAFSEAYSEWLLHDAPGALPREDGQPGFLRLPTEAEWEFAARGGITVSPEQFRARMFPMPEGMAAYVWYQGSGSAAGQRQPVGLLRPNPLGLHDMLGNVDEIVLEPFRLNRLGRLHGLPGGFVVRGGDFRTPASAIRSALRREHAPFVAGGPNRLDVVGFRLAIGVPVLTSGERLETIRADLARLSGDVRPEEGVPADPLAELGRLVEQADNPELRQRLESVTVALRSDTEQRATRAARTSGSLIRLGAFLGSQVRVAAAPVAQWRSMLAGFEGAGNEARAAPLRQNLAAAEAALGGGLDVYVDNVIVAAENFDPELLNSQYRVLRPELAARGQEELVPFAELFVRHAAQYRRVGQVDRVAWRRDLAGGGP